MKAEEIRRKIDELKRLAAEHDVDINEDLSRLVSKLEGEGGGGPAEPGGMRAWERVQLARHQDRPTTLDYIDRMSDRYIELHGDRAFADDPAMVGGLAEIDGVYFTFIGHQKGRNMKENLKRNYGMAHPEGYRKALRLAKQAEKFGRPVLSIIDTPGAYPGISAEERGIGEAIARNLKEFAALRTPVIAVIVGEGGSGGALGIGVGDYLIMLENTVYSVISPEGFASILLRDSRKAEEAAALMRMTAYDLKTYGIADEVIPEPSGGAHKDPQLTADRIKERVLSVYARLRRRRSDVLLKDRAKRLEGYGAVRGG
ncbi:MAG: acetyl-CoA carboxylase carboxyltransferase subunit alpha [Spirochaetaceae bacterium]